MRRTVTISARFAILLVGIPLACFAPGCGTAFWSSVSQPGEAAKPAGVTRADATAKGGKEESDHDKAKSTSKEDAKDEPARDKKDDDKKGDDPKADNKKDEPQEEKIPGHVNVRCVTARRLPFAITVEGLGRTEPLPECVGSLTAAVEGHVHELLVRIGDTVKAHQPILQLDPTVAKATLAEKEANKDSLVAARKLLESLPRPEERRAAELAVEQAKISVEHDELQVENLRKLLATKDVSEKVLHDEEVLLKQAKVTLQTAEAQLKLLMTGPRPEAVAEAQTKIVMAEQAVASSQESLALHTLRAPIAGVVESLNCHPGQTLTIGTPVGEVIDIRRLFVTIYFPARITRLLQPGMVAKVDLSDGSHPAAETSAKESDKDAKEKEPAAKEKEPASKEKESSAKEKEPEKESSKKDNDVVSGKVAFIGNSADPQTGNYAVRILMDNEGGRLRLGQVVKATIVLRTEEPQLAVPEAAIFDQGEGPLLAVVREGKIRLLHPELGASDGGNVAVTKTDLKEGEPVIVEGAYGVEDNKVEATIIAEPKSAESKEGEAKEGKAEEAKDAKPVESKEAKPEANKPADEKEKAKGDEHK
jgi:RND family efflux transporter MFP subunit